jgi:hypothetical protein
MSTEITINQDIVEINVTEQVVTIEAPSGAYPLPNLVSSVFGRVGNVVAQEGDYTLTQIGDVTLTSPSNGQVLKYNGTAWVNSSDTDTGLTSVGLSMPSAFSVANSPLTANGTLSVTGAGNATQYVRGDGTLADFPTSTGGGSSVSYYLNSSVSQGTIGGNAYRQLSKTPISGAGTDITASTNGYIASYITDANDPSLLEVPAGNFNCEFYFSVNSNNHNPYFYAELYKYDGTNFTLIGSSQSVPEYLTNGTTLSPYYFAIPVTQTTLAITDRIAIRIYVNVDTRVVTLHTENNHLCQVVTTFSKGLTSLNNLTRQVQFLATGTSGTDFNISSSTATHTFNLPTASATNRGLLSSADWTTFNSKQNALTNPVTGTGTTNALPKFTGASAIGNSNVTDSGTLITLGSNSFLNGSVGIGATIATGTSLNIGKTITGSTDATGLLQQGNVLSDVTTIANGFLNILNTQAASFTLSNYFHFRTTQGTIGAGSTITLQVGFLAGSNLTGATTNYGFRGAIPSGTNRWNIYMDGTANNYMAGSLGIGSLAITGFSLNVGKSITGGIDSTGINQQGLVLSDVTSSASGFYNQLTTQAASFALTTYFHYRTAQGAIGAGSSIGTQIGFHAGSNLVGATINYGFRGAIPSGTNRWNLYMDGTANNYMAGSLGIGTTSLTNHTLSLGKTITGGTTATAINSQGQVQSDVTATALYNSTFANTQAASFTLGSLVHYIAQQGTFGAGSTVSFQVGFNVNPSLIGATTNYGFRGQIPSGANRWNLYMDGTAANYLAGDTAIGTTTLGTATMLTIGGTETAVSAISRGQLINTTLVASANNDVLVGLDIAPTFTNGAFTGVTNAAIRVGGNIINNSGFSYSIGTNANPFSTINAVNYLSPASLILGAAQNLFLQAGSTTALQIFQSTRNVLIQNGGTFTDAGFRLDVNGTTRLQSDALINGLTVGRGANNITTNTFVGFTSGSSITSGDFHTAIGYQALQNNNTGQSNTAIGYQALIANTTGSNNTGCGLWSLRNNTTGSLNTGVGQGAGNNNTTGSANVFVGTGAGRTITGGSTLLTIANNSIFIGQDTRAAADNQSNQIVIGYQSTGLGSSTTVIGNTSTTLTALYGSVIANGTSINASAVLQADSTTKGFLPPRMTTTQKNAIASPATGLVVFDTTLGKLCVFAGTWQTITSI